MYNNTVRESELQNYLLVEGDDDAHLCFHLLKQYQLSGYVNIIDKKGIEKLLDELKVEIKGSGPRRLGIVVDADVDPLVRWVAIQNKLKESGYNTVPDAPSSNGTILKEDERPPIGI